MTPALYAFFAALFVLIVTIDIVAIYEIYLLEKERTNW